MNMKMNINIIKLQGTKFPILMWNLLTPPSLLCLHPDLVRPCLPPDPLQQPLPWSSCCHCDSHTVSHLQTECTHVRSQPFSVQEPSIAPAQSKSESPPHGTQGPTQFPLLPPCSHLLPLCLLTLPQPHPHCFSDHIFPAPGPLHLQSLLPRTPFPQIGACLPPHLF